MTLEAAKELDRRCVWDWLNEVYVTPSRAFNDYTDDELKMFAHDALVLLKGKEPVKPILSVKDRCYYCGNCDEIEVKTYDHYCPRCGRELKWG